MPKNISWSRGFFRVWIVYGFIVAIITGVYIYNEKPYMPRKTATYSEKFDAFPYFVRNEDFDKIVKSGKISTYKIGTHTLGFYKTTPEKTKELKIAEYRKTYQDLYDSLLWKKRMEAFKWGLGFLVGPLIIGLCIKWILIGFRRKEVG